MPPQQDTNNPFPQQPQPTNPPPQPYPADPTAPLNTPPQPAVPASPQQFITPQPISPSGAAPVVGGQGSLPPMPNQNPSFSAPVAPSPLDPQQTAQPLQPPAPQVHQPFGSAGFTPPQPMHQHKPPKQMLIVGAIVAAVAVILAVGVVYVYPNYIGSIKLKTYTSSDYSILVPTQYTEETIEDAKIFKETDAAATQSKTFVYYSKFPTTLTDEDLKTGQAKLKTELQSQLSQDDSSTSSIGKLKSVEAKDVTFKGKPAVEVNGSTVKNGKVTGKGRVIASISKDSFFIVGVSANDSDPALKRKMNTIIDSFTEK